MQKSINDALQYALYVFPLTNLTSDNVLFNILKKNTNIYLAFWRRPAKEKENINILYTFTL
jgi:hypothetical protein